ncbi:MAG: N-acetylmuramoyl-L-alanine amidase, partial [Clostridiales bacterium]|nr:N-acetylmuramoyl-L-alanine amidase [Clostridiales bacterium]
MTKAVTVINKDYDWAFPLTKRELTTHLILHHAAASKTTPDSIHAYHLSKGWAGIAYHYFIAKDGKIYRGRPENMRGGHTSNWNYCSFGICFEGNYEE